mmetsp:Transcript_110485/g.200811  ORF Transcript_110485/g.200811 Transcript_110485/m.200811 type:complete len:94 (-) Transcript_110485:16-297(-)
MDHPQPRLLTSAANASSCSAVDGIGHTRANRSSMTRRLAILAVQQVGPPACTDILAGRSSLEVLPQVQNALLAQGWALKPRLSGVCSPALWTL